MHTLLASHQRCPAAVSAPYKFYVFLACETRQEETTYQQIYTLDCFGKKKTFVNKYTLCPILLCTSCNIFGINYIFMIILDNLVFTVRNVQENVYVKIDFHFLINDI